MVVLVFMVAVSLSPRVPLTPEKKTTQLVAFEMFEPLRYGFLWWLLFFFSVYEFSSGFYGGSWDLLVVLWCDFEFHSSTGFIVLFLLF